MVRGTADANDQQSLQQNADREGIHCEAGGIDLEAEDVHNALAVIFALAVARATRLGRVGIQDTILTRESPGVWG